VGNYVIGVGNYVIVTRSNVGNYVSADSEVSGLDPERAAASIAELAAADLIRPVDSTRLFRFRHALVRSSTYGSANPVWRVGAHGRAAAALRNCGAPLTAQAHHIERAAEFGDLGAVGLLAEAANTIQTQAPGTAAQWLRAALDLLPEGDGPEQQQTALLLRLAFALDAVGHSQESRDTLHAVLLRLGAERQDTRVEAVAFCAHVERQLCHNTEGRTLLLAELSALHDRGTASAAALKFELGCAALADGDLAGSRRWAREALAVIQRCGPAGLRAAVLGLLAVTDTISGDIPNAVAHLTRGASLLDSMPDGELGQRLDAALWVGWGELLLERLVSALRHLGRGLAVAHDNRQVHAVVPLLIGRVLVLRTMGQLAEAFLAAEEAADAAVLSGSDDQQAAAQALRCCLAAWTGDLEIARTAAAAAARRLPERPRGWLAVLAVRTLADARLAMNDPEGCLALAASATGAGPPEAADWARAGWHELLIRAELAAGRTPAAARWAEAAASASWRDLPGRAGLALLALAQGMTSADPQDAYDLAVVSRDAFSSAGMVLDAARATLAGAAALAACGDPDRACAQARAAQSAFQSCGAVTFARSAAALRRRIAASGSRGSRGSDTMAHPGAIAALTRREQQVASLVSQGLTNRRMAQLLHVTDKTIEMHLSNIFTKLGVSSRTQAAAALIRAEGTLTLSPPLLTRGSEASALCQGHDRDKPGG